MAWCHDETAADLFERLHRPALRVLPLPCPPLGAGECLEILGEPGVGKSAVTAACAAGCVLPIAFGGCGARALLLDTADGFDFETLRHELHARIAAARRAEGAHAHANAAHPATETELGEDAGSDRDAVSAIIEGCMKRVLVVRCFSHFELVLALHAVRRLMLWTTSY